MSLFTSPSALTTGRYSVTRYPRAMPYASVTPADVATPYPLVTPSPLVQQNDANPFNHAEASEEPASKRRKLFTSLLKGSPPINKDFTGPDDLSHQQLTQIFKIASDAFAAVNSESPLTEELVEDFLRRVFRNWTPAQGVERPLASDGWPYGDEEMKSVISHYYGGGSNDDASARLLDQNRNPLLHHVYIIRDPPAISMRWETSENEYIPRQRVSDIVAPSHIRDARGRTMLKMGMINLTNDFCSFICERAVHVARHMLSEQAEGKWFDLEAKLKGSCNFPTFEQSILVPYPMLDEHRPSRIRLGPWWIKECRKDT